MGQLLTHHLYRPALLFLAASQLCALGAATDVPQPTYRTSAAEVRLIFSASDQNDRNVAILRANDFAVVDKDIIVRNFEGFTRSQFTQLDVAILLDSSSSMKPHYREEIAQLLGLLSKTSELPDNNFSVISFRGLQTTVLCNQHCGGVDIADLLPASRSEGLTPLYDSLIFAADGLARKSGPGLRKIVILFSDGNDTVSKNSAGDAIDALLASDAQVYVVSPNSRATAFLQALADATGGRTFRLSEGADKVAKALLSDFHTSFQITYRLPSHSTGFHAIRIVPTRDMRLHFRCRQGYYYPAGR